MVFTYFPPPFLFPCCRLFFQALSLFLISARRLGGHPTFFFFSSFPFPVFWLPPFSFQNVPDPLFFPLGTRGPLFNFPPLYGPPPLRRQFAGPCSPRSKHFLRVFFFLSFSSVIKLLSAPSSSPPSNYSPLPVRVKLLFFLMKALLLHLTTFPLFFSFLVFTLNTEPSQHKFTLD